MSYRTFQVLGLPLGGFLAHPERRFKLFQSPFWYRYPFALPCFIAGGLGAITVSVAWFVLEDVSPWHNAQIGLAFLTARQLDSSSKATEKNGI